MVASEMIKQYASRIPWITLVLYLCLGSLVLLPVLLIVGTSTPSIHAIDLENSSSFDSSEFDDDFFVLLVGELTIAVSIFSKFRGINLDFQSAFLSPDSPPPR